MKTTIRLLDSDPVVFTEPHKVSYEGEWLVVQYDWESDPHYAHRRSEAWPARRVFVVETDNKEN